MSRVRGRTLAVLVFALAVATAQSWAEAETRVPPATRRGATARARTHAPPDPGAFAQAPPGVARAPEGALRPGAAPAATTAGKRRSPPELRAARLGLGDMKAAGKLLAGRTEASWVRAAGASAGLTGTLRFPVTKGHVARGFGTGKGGYHQAVDIASEPGAKVYAAAPGIVAYADAGVSGYGNMIILVHPGGQITTYAHNQKNLVVAGERVVRGALIARLGSTGRSKGPHVHFELLFDGKNCDPMPLFRPAARRRNGEKASRVLSIWKQANKRPKSVDCNPRKHHPDYVNKTRAGEVDDEEEGAASGP
jgi:murein DD-endopeptidase MepM/ murein hydrolase activator NlpD